VEDVRGLKVRTPNGTIYIDTWKALGAVPTPMAFTELYTALQTGVVDATELPLQTFQAAKFAEVQKNVAVLNYMNDPICFSVSNKFFTGLRPELQQAVAKALKDATGVERDAVTSSFKSSADAVKAAGVKFSEPDTEPFRKAVAPVYESYFKTNGEEGRKLVDTISAVAK
jgi:TRAP-type transport system periplasmic protein